MRAGDRLRLGAAITGERRPDAGEGEERPVVRAQNQTTSFFFVSAFGSGAYSAKEFAGIRHRFSGFSHIRQSGDDVLRIFVTGGAPVRGGGGAPQRIVTSSVAARVLRITGAG